MDLYKSEAEIEEIVGGFESCETDKDAFTHASHVTVAVWYLSNHPPEPAKQKMRDALFRFLDQHNVGRQKYHETLTQFWLTLVKRTIDDMGAGASLLTTTNRVVEALSDSRLISEYYSAELLKSDEARNAWIEPDLKSL